MVRDSRVARMPHSDGRTLSSILSLAAGAGALGAGGQADADLIWNDFSNAPVTVGFNVGSGHQSSWSVALPGAAGNLEITTAGTTNSHFIVARGTQAGPVEIGGQSAHRTAAFAAYANNVAFRTAAGPNAWSTTPNWAAPDKTAPLVAGIIVKSAFVGSTLLNHTWMAVGPGTESNTYLLFRFADAGAPGGWDYGWIHLSSVTRASSVTGNPIGMSVTIDGWAYRDDGQYIGAGQTQLAAPVPEIDPASATGALAAAAGALALLEQRRRRGAEEAMGGALVAGAAGLRRFRAARAGAARQSGPAA